MRMQLRRWALRALAGALTIPGLAVLPCTSASASTTCKPLSQGGQATHVWVGSFSNGGTIASDSPGGTIHVPSGGTLYLTGVVLNGTSITFHFGDVNGLTQPFTTSNADGNCVVHHDDSQNEIPFTGIGQFQVTADYTIWESGQRVNGVFLGTIDIGF